MHPNIIGSFLVLAYLIPPLIAFITSFPATWQGVLASLQNAFVRERSSIKSPLLSEHIIQKWHNFIADLQREKASLDLQNTFAKLQSTVKCLLLNEHIIPKWQIFRAVMEREKASVDLPNAFAKVQSATKSLLLNQYIIRKWQIFLAVWQGAKASLGLKNAFATGKRFLERLQMYNIHLARWLYIPRLCIICNSRRMLLSQAVTVMVVFFATTATAATPAISADYAIIMESSTGRVLWSKAPHTQTPPASLTKMLTAIIALENLSLKERVVISQEAAATEDSFVGIEANNVLTVDNLLKALLMESDNGAAVSLGIATSGSTRDFLRLMNEKAKAIGMTSSNFANPNGLPHSEHHSTAYDMALLARYAMKNQLFRAYVGAKYDYCYFEMPAGRSVELTNTQKLLFSNPQVIGVKTGWTI